MYMDNGWTPLSTEETDFLFGKVHLVSGKYPVSHATTHALKRSLPFYDSAVLVRLKDPAWNPRNLYLYYLLVDGNIYWLNGTSQPIHLVNALAPVHLTEENCIDYLEFFCFYVRGEEGPFLIAQSMGDVYLPKNVSDRERAVLEGTVRPATYEGVNEEGHHLCDAVVFYSNALFVARFSIEPTGIAKMVSDEPIATDLSVKVHAPIS